MFTSRQVNRYKTLLTAAEILNVYKMFMSSQANYYLRVTWSTAAENLNVTKYQF